MKKVLSVFTLAVLLTMPMRAQNNQQDIELEMEKMMGQMEEMMKHLGIWMGDAVQLMDTTIVRKFHFPEDEFDDMVEQFPSDELNNMLFYFSPDSLMNSDMFKGMEQMIEQWSTRGLSDMEEFFKELEKMMPAVPEGGADDEGVPGDGSTPGKKKRKTTTL